MVDKNPPPGGQAPEGDEEETEQESGAATTETEQADNTDIEDSQTDGATEATDATEATGDEFTEEEDSKAGPSKGKPKPPPPASTEEEEETPAQDKGEEEEGGGYKKFSTFVMPVKEADDEEDDENEDNLDSASSHVGFKSKMFGKRKKKKASASRLDGRRYSEFDDEDESEEEDDDDEESASQGLAIQRDKNKIGHKHHPSTGAHLQIEITKQKFAKAKADREARKGALEAHHQYLIEVVADYLKLQTKDVVEFIVDSPLYIELMDRFFEKKGSKSVIFIYQEAENPGFESGRLVATNTKRGWSKRVMVVSGNDVGLKGEIMYFIRLHNYNKMSTKNINDEVFFGTLDLKDPDEPGTIIDTVVYNLSKIYLENLKASTNWVPLLDPELASRVRLKFITSIEHYANFLQESRNDIGSRLDLRAISDMDEVMDKLKSSDEVIEAAKNPEFVVKVEHTVITWCKNIEKVLALSKQMRKETDSMGPMAELAYWRNLLAKMCYIIQQVQEWKFINLIQVLIHAKSKVLRRWRDVDSRVTDEYHEAKDNVRYMYALEKFCEPLYQLDPPAMIEHISSMIYTIRTIHTTSRYYNSCEKVTALMVKISNQMVAACKRYLTNDNTETIWSQNRRIMVDKLKKCIQLYNTYRGCYEQTKKELESNLEGKRFNFSANHIFRRFEKFCERLKKIIELVEMFDMYQFVHESHIDGIEKISSRIRMVENELLEKTYDTLDFRNPKFDDDYAVIRADIDEIQESLERFMDEKIDNCATCMQGLELLERFRNLRNRCLDIEGKEWYLFQFYHNEISMLKSIYETEKNDTPIPRGFPPFAGKLAWSKHLFRRLERPMLWFQEKTKILDKDEAKPTIKLYNSVAKKLVFYEIIFHDGWVKQSASIYDSLEAPILTLRGNLRQELVLNFDPFFRQIIDETEIIRKMDLSIPDHCLITYYKQDKLFEKYEKIKGLLERFLTNKGKITTDLMVLFRPKLKKAEKAFMPGISNINWTSLKCEEYFQYITVHLEELETIVAKVNDIITIQINQFLYEISHTMMIDYPEVPMPIAEYMDRTRHYQPIVAKDLEYKSRACESAVIELINTLLAVCEIPVPDELLFHWLNPNIFDAKVEINLKDPTHHVGVKRKFDRGGRKNDELIASLTQSQKDELKAIHEECRHVFAFYSSKCIEALQKATRVSLDTLRRRTEEPQISKRNPEKVTNRIPLFSANLVLTIPTIQLKPTLEDIQMILTKSVNMIVECLKRVVIWGQIRRQSFDVNAEEPFYKEPDQIVTEVVPYARLQTEHEELTRGPQMDNFNPKLKNCFKPVMDYKDVSKMILMMQTACIQAKSKVNVLIKKYVTLFSYLWKDTKDQEIKEIVDRKPVITEIYAIMKRYSEIEDEINEIEGNNRIGPLEIGVEELKLAFNIEVKQWKTQLCKLLNEDYKTKANALNKFIEEVNKDLNQPIRDMNDIRALMNTMERIRENFSEQDSIIRPIEECYAFLGSQNYKVPEDESNRVDTLRYNFDKLQSKSLEVQLKISSIQEENRKTLMESISKFRSDLVAYAAKYNRAGPMVVGIPPQEASDRLITFQDAFDELNERYTMCNFGEKLFGLQESDYPLLKKLKTELALLQKLYGLYNEVIRSITGYYDVKWSEMDVKKIKSELTEYQNRCKKLPKGLRNWPAYLNLKKKIDDFCDLCPLLELMANTAMKDRHWEAISAITKYPFDVDNENFTLKQLMDAPLKKFYPQIEDICLGSIREREIEGILKQLAADWLLINMSLGQYKFRGELLLKKEEMGEVMKEAKKALKALNDIFKDRYSGLYRTKIQLAINEYTNTLKILEQWFVVQKQWIFLEVVFGAGGDVSRALPLEAKRFRNVDRSWVKLMKRAKENPIVLQCCVGDETMAQLLPHMHEQLEICLATLSGFLEHKYWSPVVPTQK